MDIYGNALDQCFLIHSITLHIPTIPPPSDDAPTLSGGMMFARTAGNLVIFHAFSAPSVLPFRLKRDDDVIRSSRRSRLGARPDAAALRGEEHTRLLLADGGLWIISLIHFPSICGTIDNKSGFPFLFSATPTHVSVLRRKRYSLTMGRGG